MEVVDAHQHFWDREQHSYEWLSNIAEDSHMAPLKKPYLIEHFTADALPSGVCMSVHVQAEMNGDPVVETEWLEQLAQTNPKGFPHAIVGFVDLSKEDAPRVLDRHVKASNRFCGVRQMLNWDPERPEKNVASEDLLSNDTWRKNLREVERRGLTFDLHIEPRQMEACAQLSREHPSMTFVLDHIGCPSDRDQAGFQFWKRGIDALAAQPNVVCKISGLIHPAFTKKGEWSFDTLFPWVEAVVQAFSPARCMFGSNFPVDGVVGGYSDVFNTTKATFDKLGLSEADQRAIFKDNAAQVYHALKTSP